MASVRLYTLLDEMADDSDSVDNWQTNMLTPGYFANVMSQAAMGVKKLVLAFLTDQFSTVLLMCLLKSHF